MILSLVQKKIWEDMTQVYKNINGMGKMIIDNNLGSPIKTNDQELIKVMEELESIKGICFYFMAEFLPSV